MKNYKRTHSKQVFMLDEGTCMHVCMVSRKLLILGSYDYYHATKINHQSKDHIDYVSVEATTCLLPPACSLCVTHL